MNETILAKCILFWHIESKHILWITYW